MLSILEKLLNFSIEKVKTKKNHKTNSKVYALARLKESHNYDYSTFVAQSFENQNYVVWNYSKEKNLIDHEINLILKKNNDILIVQCKNNYSLISIDNIVMFEHKVKEFLLEYKMFKNYNINPYFVFPEHQFDKSAFQYIKEHKNINFKILKEHSL